MVAVVGVLGFTGGPPPPLVVQNWSAPQCSKQNTEQCGYDHAPVTRGRMRAQFPLPHGPLYKLRPCWRLTAPSWTVWPSVPRLRREILDEGIRLTVGTYCWTFHRSADKLRPCPSYSRRRDRNNCVRNFNCVRNVVRPHKTWWVCHHICQLHGAMDTCNMPHARQIHSQEFEVVRAQTSP